MSRKPERRRTNCSSGAIINNIEREKELKNVSCSIRRRSRLQLSPTTTRTQDRVLSTTMKTQWFHQVKRFS